MWRLLPLPENGKIDEEGNAEIYPSTFGSYFEKPNLFVGLPAASDNPAETTSWDWKGANVDRLNTEYSLDVFSAQSVTPDTTLLLAGPPRLDSDTQFLTKHPIGLVQGISYSVDNQLKPIWEIGNDRTLFTRGKALHTLQVSKLLAHQDNLLRALTKEAGFIKVEGDDEHWKPRERGGPGYGPLWLNLASMETSVPFGIMMVFKTKAGYGTPETESDDHKTAPLECVYLENCNIGNLAIDINSQNPTVQENITIMFDRMVPIDVRVKGEE